MALLDFSKTSRLPSTPYRSPVRQATAVEFREKSHTSDWCFCRKSATTRNLAAPCKRAGLISSFQLRPRWGIFGISNGTVTRRWHVNIIIHLSTHNKVRPKWYNSQQLPEIQRWPLPTTVVNSVTVWIHYEIWFLKCLDTVYGPFQSWLSGFLQIFVFQPSLAIKWNETTHSILPACEEIQSSAWLLHSSSSKSLGNTSQKKQKICINKAELLTCTLLLEVEEMTL